MGGVVIFLIATLVILTVAALIVQAPHKKRCPECATLIPRLARKCPRCQSVLVDDGEEG